MAVDTGVAPTRSPAQLALLVGALGVVFGDIGTSPIYTVQTVFNPDDPHPVPANADSVYGVISLIFWSVTIIVTIKYVLLVMRADNDGEGGILALITLIRRCGVNGIAGDPQILKALLPTYAVGFLVGHFSIAFFSLAAVVLAITGAEALYADMGHFGRPPITRAWLGLVFPARILSYLGQGALVLEDPTGAISSPFFLLVPEWGRLPMVLLATAATVIASQAVITGAFSVSHQAVQLGYLPRLRINHTSAQTIGQIYVPWINWVLMISVLTLVFAFKSSAALAFAFGMAVTGTITITTLLFFYIVRQQWRKPLWMVLAGGGAFLLVEVLFLAANTTKILYGAWVPLLIAVPVFTVLTTWQRGRAVVTERREHDEGSLRAFVDELHARRPPVQRVPGTAVFLNRGKATAPLAMRANVAHNHILHEHVVILSIETSPVPHVAPADRVVVDDLGYTDDGISHVTAYFGYMQDPNVPDVLRLADAAGLEGPLDVDDASYFLSTIELRVGRDHGMTRWRKRLFVATARITTDAAEYFGLPRDRTVIMGSRITV